MHEPNILQTIMHIRHWTTPKGQVQGMRSRQSRKQLFCAWKFNQKILQAGGTVYTFYWVFSLENQIQYSTLVSLVLRGDILCFSDLAFVQDEHRIPESQLRFLSVPLHLPQMYFWSVSQISISSSRGKFLFLVLCFCFFPLDVICLLQCSIVFQPPHIENFIPEGIECKKEEIELCILHAVAAILPLRL